MTPNKQHNSKIKSRERETEITYDTQNKLFINKSSKPEGHLNIVLKINRIYKITR